MKKLAGIPIFFLFILIISACRQDPAMPTPPVPPAPIDPCDTITCDNGGTCDNGKCLCPTGYSGTNCEIYYTTLLAGTYTSTNFNCGFFPVAGDATVRVSPDNKDQLILPNGLVANIKGNKFEIEPRTVSAVAMWGDGYFEGEKMHLKLYFGSPLTGVLGTCEGDYYKVE